MPEPYQVFLSHASEDKNAVALPLHDALTRANLRVWLDREELKLGHSIPGTISDGLRDSQYVVVILSRAFFAKEWPRRELEASIDKLLPVLYGVTPEQVKAEMPMVGALESVSWDLGEAIVTAAILERIQAGPTVPRSDVAVDLAHGQADIAGRKGWDDLEAAIDSLYPAITKLRHGIFEESAVFDKTRVLILPPPRKYRFAKPEVDKIESWVAKGGGLLVMGHYAERHHDMNISEVAWRFNLEFGDDVVLPPAHVVRGHARSVDPKYIVRALPSAIDHPLAAGIREAAFISAATVRSTTSDWPEFTLDTTADAVVARPLGLIDPAGARECLDDQVEERRGPVSLLAARRWKKGRVIAAGTWKLFTVEQADNVRLIANVIDWLRGSSA
jgi:hypothetical protein